MYLSCDTKKFHDNESTRVLHNFWTSTMAPGGSFSPFPRLAAPLTLWTRHSQSHSSVTIIVTSCMSVTLTLWPGLIYLLSWCRGTARYAASFKVLSTAASLHEKVELKMLSIRLSYDLEIQPGSSGMTQFV